MDDEGTIKVLDMGLARFDAAVGEVLTAAQEGLTQSGQVMGTVDYMAPEQAFDTRHADARADIYSLGCTLYRLLTGENLYGGETLVQKLLAHREQPIPSLRAARAEMPEALDRILSRMVAKQPQDRYATMSELVRELESYSTHHAPRDAQTSHLAPRDGIHHAERDEYIAQPKTHSSSGRRSSRGARWLLYAAGGCILLAGIIIIIRNQQGDEVARVTAPDGSTVSIERSDSKPLDKPAAKPSAPTTAKPLKPSSPKPSVRKPIKPDEPLWTPPVGADGKMLFPPGRVSTTGLIPRPAIIPGLGQWLVEPFVPADGCGALTISPDDRWIAVLVGGNIRVYDRTIWKPVANLGAAMGVKIAWSPDGKWLATVLNSSTANVQLWNANFTPGPIWKLPAGAYGNVRAIAWHPRSEWLAIGYVGDSGAQLWRPDGTPGPLFKGHMKGPSSSAGVTSIAWSPDGNQLVSVAVGDNAARVWNVDGTPVRELKGDSGPSRVVWGPEGIVTGGVYHIQFWRPDGTAGARVRTAAVYGVDLSWSPDGQVLAAVSRPGDGLPPTPFAFFRTDGSLAREPAPAPTDGGHSTTIAWNSAGTEVIASGGYGIATVGLDGTVTRPVKSISTSFKAVGWNVEGTRLVAADRRSYLRMWDQNGKILRAWQPDQQVPHSLRWSPTGEQFAVGYDNGNVRLFDAEGSDGPVWQGHASTVGCLAWRADGQQLATGGDDMEVRVWDLPGKLVSKLSGHIKPIRSLDWSRLGLLVSVEAGGGPVLAWNLASGQSTPWGKAHDVAWSPDGAQLVAVHDTGTLQYYDQTGRLISTFAGPKDTRVRWTSDGRHLLCAAAGDFKVMSLHGQLEWNLTGTGGYPAISGRGHATFASGNRLSTYDDGTGEPLWVAVALDDGKSATFTAGGQLIDCSGDPDQELIYLVQHENTSRYDVRTHTEFQKLVADAYAADAAARKGLPDDPQRRAAERFLTLGAKLTLKGMTATVTKLVDLPAKEFVATNLWLSGAQLGAYDWALLPSFPELQVLDLPDCTNGDHIARHIPSLPRLTTLSVGPGLTDEGLEIAHLHELKELITLTIRSPQITDRGLAHLKLLKGLRALSIAGGPGITDDGLANLRDMTVLSNLMLNDTSVTDAGLDDLQRFELQSLHLKGAKITDSGLAKLTNQKSLTGLYLSGTSIGDAGLAHLAALPKIATLDVTDTQVTKAGLEKFQAALGRKITITANAK